MTVSENHGVGGSIPPLVTVFIKLYQIVTRQSAVRAAARFSTPAFGPRGATVASLELTLPVKTATVAKALNAVIIGCVTPTEARDEIARIVQASGHGVTLKQAVRGAEQVPAGNRASDEQCRGTDG